MNLYLVSTNVFSFFVLADSFSEASSKVELELNKAKYGFSSERVVTEVKLQSSKIEKDKNKESLNFSSGNTLIF